ncbi:type VII toxin-antitoxin system MntA family adenylyltransferase antitoxin [Thermoanaerobacterium sp. DL9XJH110]|jgi:hypothetical protein|uniref:type VII toxin-antitoxin system MntA family adenylyltransferase antitoxin n=1 Tax=Thermoanaerobacterium sp. DL9XJH110 TaxID=3386643 RepID=UPI003BB5A94D
MIKFGSKLPKDILVKAVEKLPEVFEKRPDIVAGYIYGSHATGKTTDLSDIDIAVLLQGETSFEAELELIGDISEALHTDDFDLVILNNCPPYLQYEVISSGRLIYEKDRELRCDFQVKALQRYFDVKHIYDEYNYYLKKRIREGRMIN